MATSEAHQSTQRRQRVTTLVPVGLAILFLCLRLAARRIKRVGLGLDDWTVIVGLVMVLILAGVNLACIHYGMGTHLSTMTRGEELNYFKWSYVFEPVYITTAGIIKLSVLLMYRRIFPARLITVGGGILAAITIAWVVSIDLVAIFQCTPVSKAWDRAQPGHCINFKAALIGNGVPNFVTDMCILALPVKLVWRLQTGLWQRISVICVLLTGSFVVFASIYRFSLIFQVNIDDISWTIADAQTWCVVEVAAAIISACLPMVAPLVKACTGLRLTARSNLSQSNTQSYGKGSIRMGNLVTAPTDSTIKLSDFDGNHHEPSHGNGWRSSDVASDEHPLKS